MKLIKEIDINIESIQIILTTNIYQISNIYKIRNNINNIIKITNINIVHNNLNKYNEIIFQK